MARMYDYWLGGKDNYEADRKAADAVREFRPNVAEQAPTWITTRLSWPTHGHC